MDEVAQALGEYNPHLISVDFWKTYSLTPVGVRAIAKCRKLQEVDFGWCLGVSIPGDCLSLLASSCPELRKLFMVALRGILDKDLDPFIQNCKRLEQVDLLGVRSISQEVCLSLGVSIPGDCLSLLASSCPELRKLFMVALRGILDKDLDPFIQNCKRLEQVDLLGVRSISQEVCLR
ncbi:F-box/LRR-repeat protein 4-like [Diaphorina citri]|uniref:F-box/LRR-repeat protein 4-like n=1 Tax=Diaphorina citri TaxID=121845 RepID=A0A3Q0J265_DIACI|nr:F-box/LRR-repeat protein 4-like [Diaphorina citri]